MLGLVVAAAFNPSIQTWAVQSWLLPRALARFPGVQGSIGAVSAGLHDVELTDLKLARGGAVLTVPQLRAQLPVLTALRDGRLLVQTVVAKGWTLDLPGAALARPPPDTAQTPAPSEAAAATATPARSASASSTDAVPGGIGRWLGWTLPFEGSVRTADLEGQVSKSVGPGGDPVRFHVRLQGGGLAAGTTAKFAVTVSPDATGLPFQVGRVRGDLAVALTSGRVVDHVAFDGLVLPLGGAHGAHVVASVGGLAAPGQQVIQFDADRNGRRLAAIHGTCSDETGSIAGTWAIDLRETEVARLWPQPPLRLHSVAGNGTFQTAAGRAAVQATGRVQAVASRLAGFAPWLGRVRPLNIEVSFAASGSGDAIRLEQLRGTAADDEHVTGHDAVPRGRLLASVEARQPFTVSTTTWQATPERSGTDWLDISLHDWPVAWLPPLPGGIAFGAGEVTGGFTLVAGGGKIGLRPRTPFTARGVAIRRAGRLLAGGLDLSLALQADNTPAQGWTFHAAPLTIARGGHQLARADATLSLKRDDYGRVPLTATWTADLDAIRLTLPRVAAEWPNAATASGSFIANLGSAADLMGNVTVTGHDATHVVTAKLSGSMDDYRSATFDIPVRIALGGPAAEVEFTGSWQRNADGPRLDLQVSSAQLTIDQARWLAQTVPPLRPLWRAAAGAADAPRGGAMRLRGTSSVDAGGNPAPAPRPFWGAVTGRIRFDVQRVLAAKAEWDGLGGTIELQHGYVALHGGRLAYNPILPQKYDAEHIAQRNVEPHSAIELEGKISFEPGATAPYALAAKGSVDMLDAVRVLGAPADAEQPAIEGHFAVADTITSTGANIAELLAERRDEFRITSDAGTVRLLKTNVAAALPNAPTPVADTFASVGSAVSALFGHKTGPGNVKLSPKTDAVLNFSYDVAEIGFDHFSATAIRDADGAVEIRDVSIHGSHAHLTGSGRIAATPTTLGFAERPLSLALTLAVDGISAQRLGTAGLLAQAKDPAGFAVLREPIRIGGSLHRIDNTAWRDLLAKAAR